MLINAKNLINYERLDLVIKYMYVKFYMENSEKKDFIEELYRKHIYFRTYGVEDQKKKIDDYCQSFNQLIISLKNQGFLENFEIPINQDRILDGAHRVSASAYFNYDIKTKCSMEKSNTWSYEWFNKYDFTLLEINFIIKNYFKITSKNRAVFILWSLSEKEWGNIEKIISNNVNAVYIKEINLNFSKEMENLVYDIYSFENHSNIPELIKAKAKIMSSGKLKFKVIVVEEKVKNNEFNDEIKKIKNKIRNEIKISNTDKFSIMHSSDTSEEADYLIDLLFNENTYKFLAYKNYSLRKEFLNWLIEYSEVLKANKIPKKQTCIVGSSAMEVFNIRDSTDIDFILSDEIRNLKFDNNINKLSRNVDLVNKGYSLIANCGINDEKIILGLENYFYFKGFKFIDLELVYQRKKWQKRDKDLKDISLIQDFFYDFGEENKFKKDKIFIKKIKFMIYKLEYKIKRFIICLLPLKIKKILKEKMIKT